MVAALHYYFVSFGWNLVAARYAVDSHNYKKDWVCFNYLLLDNNLLVSLSSTLPA